MVQAQVLNTDKTIALDSSKKTQASISVSIATDQQKKSLVDLFYAGDFTMIGKKNATTLYTKIDRVTNGGISIQDVGTFQLKNNHQLGKKLYLENFLQYQWDAGLGLESRTLAGINLVHNFKNTETEDFVTNSVGKIRQGASLVELEENYTAFFKNYYAKRLLTVDNILTLPIKTNIAALITSTDVLHS